MYAGISPPGRWRCPSRAREWSVPKRAPVAEVERILRLYRDRYRGFNARHFYQVARREHAVALSYTFVKALLQRAGLVGKGRVRGRHRRRREPRACFGELLGVGVRARLRVDAGSRGGHCPARRAPASAGWRASRAPLACRAAPNPRGLARAVGLRERAHILPKTHPRLARSNEVVRELLHVNAPHGVISNASTTM
jgi:hypothetical protein